MNYSVYFRESVIRKYLDESDYHPAYGQDYYRPLDLSVRQFYIKCETETYDWYKWPEIRKDLPNLVEMVEALEGWGYKFHIVKGITDFVDRPNFERIKYGKPIVKISKKLTKTTTDSHPVLLGMLYDKEIKKRNALIAISLIKQGMVIRQALKQAHSSYQSMLDYGYVRSGRQMPRRTIKKVGECIKRIEAGEKLKSVLKNLRLGSWSYYRYKHYY